MKYSPNQIEVFVAMKLIFFVLVLQKKIIKQILKINEI